MKYKCRKGCMRQTRSGPKPLWHESTRECPFEPNYAGPSADASPAGTGAIAKPPAASTTPATSPVPPSKPGVGLFTFGGRPASTTTRTAPSTTQVQPEWEVDADHSLSLFELFDTILVRVIRFGDHALSSADYQVKEFQGHVLLNSTADEELVKKKMGRKIATTFTRALGASSQEEAHGIIESGGVLVIVGGGLMAVGSHVLVEWRPAVAARIKKRKEKAKKPAGEQFPAPAGTVLPDGTVAE